jgi:integrase
MGRVFLRGKTYWIEYYHNGKQIRETSRSKTKAIAQRFLKSREGGVAEGRTPGVYFDKILFEELAQDFLTDYRINNRKSLERAECSVKHLKKHFDGMRASGVDSARISQYINARLDSGAANATINRELAALKRMFTLAVRCTPPKIDRAPHIALLRENNARKGFFEHSEFTALRDALPEYLKGVATFAYRSGWRVSEIRSLAWEQVDLVQGIVTLNPGETKNNEARTMYLDDELKDIFFQQWHAQERRGKLLAYVFTDRTGTGRLKRFKKDWEQACSKAKIGERLFHDFRRTACRNMVRAGIPERVAMQISGHKTRSIFDRYNIVNDDDLKTASLRQASFLDGLSCPTSTKTRTKSHKLLYFPQKKDSRKNA